MRSAPSSRARNRTRFLAALAASGIAACAAMDSELTAARESWRGATYEEVVAVWGAPARSVKSGSRDNHTWTTEDRVARSGGSGGAGGVVFAADGGKRCDRTLVFSQGRVVNENWAGDPGLCKRFARRK
jgi:hypothetical protein